MKNSYNRGNAVLDSLSTTNNPQALIQRKELRLRTMDEYYNDLRRVFDHCYALHIEAYTLHSLQQRQAQRRRQRNN